MANEKLSADVEQMLHGVAGLIRQAHRLQPQGLQLLGDLVDELGGILGAGRVPAAALVHLGETIMNLAELLDRQADQPANDSVRERFEKKLIDMEVHAPVAAGITRRLLETLRDLGI